MSNQVYEIAKEKILNKIKQAEESGEKFHWVKPWTGGCEFPCAYTTSKIYRGINAVLLEPGEYITFKKMLDEKKKNPDIHLEKGARKNVVFFFKFKEKEEKVNDEIVKVPKPIFRYYSVYDIGQVHGLESKFIYVPKEHTLTQDTQKADEFIEEYCKREGVSLNVVSGSGRASYRFDDHLIRLPDKSQFKSLYEYYSTCFHELCHSTGKKLNRDLSGFFGNDQYAREELVAEIGANMLCTRFHIIDDSSAQNNIAYLQSWSTRIQDEKSGLIVQAANQAQKACDLICNEVYKEIEPNIEEKPKEKKRVTVR